MFSFLLLQTEPKFTKSYITFYFDVSLFSVEKDPADNRNSSQECSQKVGSTSSFYLLILSFIVSRFWS